MFYTLLHITLQMKKKLTCVRVGDGQVASLHEKNYTILV